MITSSVSISAVGPSAPIMMLGQSLAGRPTGEFATPRYLLQPTVLGFNTNGATFHFEITGDPLDDRGALPAAQHWVLYGSDPGLEPAGMTQVSRAFAVHQMFTAIRVVVDTLPKGPDTVTMQIVQ